MTIEDEFEEPFGSMLLASLQEGEEWLSRLQKEQALLEMDILAANENISEIGIASLLFSFQKTKDAIEQIKLEMMMLDE